MMLNLLFSDPLTYLMASVAILLAFTVHEYSHAQAGDLLGDKTARALGRLTLNPLKHIDPLGFIFILIIGFGWGKPVPFNPLNIKNKRWGPALIALAGPMSNLSMAIIIGLILRFVPIANVGLNSFLVIFVWLNVVLGVFNLIPIPPLDGSHIFMAFLDYEKAQRYKMTFLKNNFLSIILAIFVMIYIVLPYIARPLFGLIVGGSPIF